MTNNLPQVIDLTNPYTLANHADMANAVIDLNDTIDFNIVYEVHHIRGRHGPLETIDLSEIPIPGTGSRTRSARLGRHTSENSTNETNHAPQEVNESGEDQIQERSPNKIVCPICYENIGKNPLYSTICGHVFCQTCLEQSLHIEKKCPTCRKPLRKKNDFHPIFLNTS